MIKLKEYFKSEHFKADMKELVDTVLFVVIAMIIIRFFIFDVRYIPSESMVPTLIIHDRLIVERYTRFYKTPDRGDIMVFYPPYLPTGEKYELKNGPILLFKRLTGFFCKDVAFIKRVIGLPGEKFEIKCDKKSECTVYIDDKPLEEPYISTKRYLKDCLDPRTNCGPFVIPENNYMMLGDNRDSSWDSRYWGTLDKSRFIGRATFRFWPLTRIKMLNIKNTSE